MGQVTSTLTDRICDDSTGNRTTKRTIEYTTIAALTFLMRVLQEALSI